MLRDAVLQAAARDDVHAAVRRVYADLQREIDLRKPVCTASGRCCRFEDFGHRLYITTIELAAFVRDLQPGDRAAADPGNTAGCPFQLAGLCSVHAIRPFGCRVFFCDATSDDWQHEQYERFHAQLKRLHEELGVPYQYVEWRHALRELGELVLPRGGGAVAGSAGETASGTGQRLSLPQLPF